MAVVAYDNFKGNTARNLKDPVNLQDAATKNYVDEIAGGAVTLATVVGTLYPVGAIYISTLSTNPGTLFGIGTWAVFGAGKALVGLDSGDADFDTVEETRGAKTHTLTGAESGQKAATLAHAAHNHTLAVYNGSGTGTTYARSNVATGLTGNATTADATVGSHSIAASDASSAHNNIQPSIVVYMWKRTA